MRRVKDDWVNATQILKSCNFPKAKRTKILEKGVQLGMHEKVQGGFGRFQGTWVPLPDAQRLASTYGLAPELAPVLYLDPSDPTIKINPRIKPPPKEPTPVKRKYVKKPKIHAETPTKPSFNRAHTTSLSVDVQDPPAGQFELAGRARSASGPVPFFNNGQSPFYLSDGSLAHSTNQKSNVMESTASTASQSQMHPQYIPDAKQQDQRYAYPQDPQQFQPVHGTFHNYQLQAPAMLPQQQQQQMNQQMHPQMHQHPSLFQAMEQHHRHNSSVSDGQMLFHVAQKNPPLGMMHVNQGHFVGHNYSFPNKLLSQSTNELSHDDLSSKPPSKESDTSISSNEDMSLKVSTPYTAPMPAYSAQLLRFFSDDLLPIPAFLYNPPFDFNIDKPIDDEGHTALHWAASIGNYGMISLLLSKNANPLVVNNLGLNPLSKLISFNNCYEMRNFNRVLDDLETCLIHTDINGRTPLHYLMQFSKVKSKFDSLKYYLESIIYKLHAMRDANPNSKIDLLRNVINHRDVNGDTSLHLAVMASSAEFAKVLMLNGARDDLPNTRQETARFLMEQLDWQPSGHSSVPVMSMALEPGPVLGFVNHPPVAAPQYQVAEPQTSYVMETPMRPSNDAETPDTHRTTLAGAASDDEQNDSVRMPPTASQQQLDALHKSTAQTLQDTRTANRENKENIFQTPVEVKTSMVESTPQRGSRMDKDNDDTPQDHSVSMLSQQPLAAISERTAESTPARHYELPIAPTRITLQGHCPQPPMLDENGTVMLLPLKHGRGRSSRPSSVSRQDFSSMVSGMVNSLGDNYAKEIGDIEADIKRIEWKAQDKKRKNKESLMELKRVLVESGVEQNVGSFSEANAVVDDTVTKCALELQRLNAQLHKRLASCHARKVKDVHRETLEGKLIETESPKDIMALAIRLTQLQIQQKHLLQQYTGQVREYAVDEKMYKFRKLIGISCSVRVEEVDTLIDRILRHWVETASSSG